MAQHKQQVRRKTQVSPARGRVKVEVRRPPCVKVEVRRPSAHSDMALRDGEVEVGGIELPK